MVKVFVGLFLIGSALYMGVMLIPPFWGNYEFQDAIRTEATMQTYTTKPEADIRDSMYKKAQEYGIPVEKEQIKVMRTGSQGSGSITITVPYTVHVDVPGYPFDLHFNASTSNQSPM
jgi:hypothetical protein